MAALAAALAAVGAAAGEDAAALAAAVDSAAGEEEAPEVVDADGVAALEVQYFVPLFKIVFEVLFEANVFNSRFLLFTGGRGGGGFAAKPQGKKIKFDD